MENQIQNIKILFFGDLVGRPGRFAVRDFLSDVKMTRGQEGKLFTINNLNNICDNNLSSCPPVL